MRKRAKLLGYEIDTFSFEEAVNFAENISGQVVTINPEMMSDPDMIDLVNSSELVIPDGIGVQIGLKIKGFDVKRIPGIQFAYKMLEETSLKKQTVALIGAKPKVIEQAVKNLKDEIKDINIVYIQNGYFEDDERVIGEIKEISPRLVLCALGSPKQEYFIQEAKKALPESLFIGVGGSFDVWAGAVERAPEIWQKYGLEWLYRTIKEPKKAKENIPDIADICLESFKREIYTKRSLNAK